MQSAPRPSVSTCIYGRLTYFGTCSARLRALIGLDLLIVVHLYRVSEARICPRVVEGTEDRDGKGNAISSMGRQPEYWR